MKKKIVLLTGILLSISIYSKINAQYDYRTYNFSYMHGKKTLDIFKYTCSYTPEGNTFEYLNIEPETFKLRWTPLNIELMMPNTYIYFGGNFHYKITDSIANLRSKEVDYYQIKFAFGVNIADKFSLLIGPQAELRMLLTEILEGGNYSSISSLPSFEWQPKTVDLYFGYYGGYHYGGNLTFYTTFSEFFCFRSSVLLSKVTYKGIWGNDAYQPKYIGLSVEDEFVLSLFLPGEKVNAGLKIGYIHRNLNLNCVDQYDNSKIFIPENSSSANYFMIGLLLGKVKKLNY